MKIHPLSEQIASLMTDRLFATPGWNTDLPMPDVAEARRIAARLEAEIQWLEAEGFEARDHVATLINLRRRLPIFAGEDAMGRVRAFGRAWDLY